jgi:hypothetical protein
MATWNELFADKLMYLITFSSDVICGPVTQCLLIRWSIIIIIIIIIRQPL